MKKKRKQTSNNQWFSFYKEKLYIERQTLKPPSKIIPTATNFPKYSTLARIFRQRSNNIRQFQSSETNYDYLNPLLFLFFVSLFQLFDCLYKPFDYISSESNKEQFHMRKAHLIVHQVREPIPLNIRLFTEFVNLEAAASNQDQLIAVFFLYTKSAVFEGKLKKIDINVQLAWNEQCVSALSDALSGKKNNVQIKFQEQLDPTLPSQMSLICEIQTAINVRIFQINMFKLQGAKPLIHMKNLFMEFKEAYGSEQRRLKQQKQRIQQQIKEMGALQRQIEEQTITEVAHLKKNFIDVVNECKKQLRKHMKIGISDIVTEQQEIDDEKQTISKRRIVRVDREAIEKTPVRYPKNQPVQNEYMDMLFDS